MIKNNSEWGEEKNGGLKSKMAAPRGERSTEEATGGAAYRSLRRAPRERVPRAPSQRPRGAAASTGCRRRRFLLPLLLLCGEPSFLWPAEPGGRLRRPPRSEVSCSFSQRSPRRPRPVRGDAACPCAPGSGGTPREALTYARRCGRIRHSRGNAARSPAHIPRRSLPPPAAAASHRPAQGQAASPRASAPRPRSRDSAHPSSHDRSAQR